MVAPIARSAKAKNDGLAAPLAPIRPFFPITFKEASPKVTKAVFTTGDVVEFMAAKVAHWAAMGAALCPNDAAGKALLQ
eukprot:symbB.v1.2.011907.t1/scaffold811.1/size160404/6